MLSDNNEDPASETKNKPTSNAVKKDDRFFQTNDNNDYDDLSHDNGLDASAKEFMANAKKGEVMWLPRGEIHV